MAEGQNKAQSAQATMASRLYQSCADMAEALVNPSVRDIAAATVRQYQFAMMVEGDPCADHVKHEAAIAYQVLDSALAIDPKSERGERLRGLLKAAGNLVSRAIARGPDVTPEPGVPNAYLDRKDVFG